MESSVDFVENKFGSSGASLHSRAFLCSKGKKKKNNGKAYFGWIFHSTASVISSNYRFLFIDVV